MEVSKTTNSGSSWTRFELTTTAGHTYSLAVDPSNSNIVYAGGNSGLYKTINGGNTWVNSSTGLSGYVYDIAINPTTTSTLYAGTPNGVFKSTDSGTNWTDTGCIGVRAVLIDPNNNIIIYAGTSSGVYKSITGGGGWTVMNDGLDDTNVTSLGIYPSVYLFAGTESAGMFRWNLNVGVEEEVKLDGKCVFYARPNPMKNTTSILYHLQKKTVVNLSVYDAQGRLVKTLVNESQNAGTHATVWNGVDDKDNFVATGVYFYKLSTDEAAHIAKLILVR